MEMSSTFLGGRDLRGTKTAPKNVSMLITSCRLLAHLRIASDGPPEQ
jgi:hypothetical protein